METRLKILVSAYACEPGRGSEPEVGWRWALILAREHDVTVVTRANNRTLIEPALAAAPGPHPHFLYYDPPRWILSLKRRGLPVMAFYALWQIGVRLFVRARLPEFDLVHHVTFNSFLIPGFWWFCGRPVVLGPLGGGMTAPLRFLRLFGGQAVQEALRSLVVLTAKWNPFLQLSLSQARAILVANADTRRRIPVRFTHRVSQMLETALDAPAPAAISKSDDVVRVVWIGSLIKRKGGTLALDAVAVAAAQNPNLRMTIVGSGPEEAGLRARAEALGIADRVTWEGRIGHAEILALLATHQIFLFTSLRDTSGNVILEAMAAALPVVTLNHHGAAEITTDETALRVEPRTIAQATRDLADALVRLAASPELRARLGHAGRQRLDELFTWQAKVGQMRRIYADAVKKQR